MNDSVIQTIDAFLKQHLEERDFFADGPTLEQALEDDTGGGSYLPLMYSRTLPDPEDPSRLLVCFSYGTDTLDHELQAPARVKQCMDALYTAHPEVAATPIRLDIGGF